MARGIFLFLSLLSCHKDPEVTTRVVTANVPAMCAPDTSAFVSYQELGDFEAPATMAGHTLGDVGAELTEITTQAKALDVTAKEGQATWLAQGTVPPTGDVDVLLLPELAPCALSGQIDSRATPVLVPFGDRRLMIVGGATPRQVPHTFVARLDTGEVAAVGGLLTTRTGASATAFGDGVLVAGGTSNVDGSIQPNAEVYVGASNSFDGAPIALGGPRTSHGGAVLVTGETLLVGGSNGTSPLASMAVVDPSTRKVRTDGLALLATARISPTVLVLASGEILVAGGTDAGGLAVSELEWFLPDASRSAGTQSLVTGSARTYVALPAGGALAVIAPPEPTGPRRRGAPSGFTSVWFIGPKHDLEPAKTQLGVPLTDPVLVGGAGGAPLLWTGDHWLRWQPWEGAFGPVEVATAATRLGPAAAAPDPGLAAWLTPDTTTDGMETTTLSLLRFDVDGPYSSLPAALLVADTNYVAPDHLPSPSTVTFDATRGLVLQSPVGAFVTDRTYADFALDVDFPGAMDAAPAAVALRDDRGVELDIGNSSCGPSLVTSAAQSTMHVERHGAEVAWSMGASSGTCPLPDGARVSIGVRAVTSTAIARNLRITRTGGS